MNEIKDWDIVRYIGTEQDLNNIGIGNKNSVQAILTNTFSGRMYRNKRGDRFTILKSQCLDIINYTVQYDLLELVEHLPEPEDYL